MTKEAYCSYEVAKLLKEKGFNEECYRFYEYDTKEFYKESIPCCNSRSDDYACPTHQMAMAWLRERGWFIEVHVSVDLNGKYHFMYMILDKACKCVMNGKHKDTYEESIEEALKYSLENLI